MTWNTSGRRNVFHILVILFFAEINVQAASVANITVKSKIINAELNASDSRQIYRTAASPRGRNVPSSTPEHVASASVGYYNAEPVLQEFGRRESPMGEQRSASLRARQVRPGLRRSDMYEEDPEYHGEGHKTMARPAASTRAPGYKPFGGSQIESDAELINEKPRVAQPASGKLRVGYKPFGGGEVSDEDGAAEKAPILLEEDYKPAEEEEESPQEEAPENDSDGAHSTSDHEDIHEENVPVEDGDSAHIEEGSGGGTEEHTAASNGEESEDGGAAHIEAVDTGDAEGEEKSHEDTKAVTEDVEDAPHTQAEISGKSGDYSSAPLHGHHHGKSKSHKFVKGGAKKKIIEHHASAGEKGEKGYKKNEAHDHGDHGKHDKEAHKAELSKKDGHKKSHLDEEGKYASAEEGEKGSKAADFDDKGKHKKGSSTKGFRKVHRKDEFQKDETFYDETDNSGHHNKKGSAQKNHEKKKGAKSEKKHHNSKLDEGHKSKHDEKGHGAKVAVKKGHKGSASSDSQHKQLSKTSKNSEKHAHKEAAHHSKY